MPRYRYLCRFAQSRAAELANRFDPSDSRAPFLHFTPYTPTHLPLLGQASQPPELDPVSVLEPDPDNIDLLLLSSHLQTPTPTPSRPTQPWTRITLLPLLCESVPILILILYPQSIVSIVVLPFSRQAPGVT
ncbi:hypothetical protein LZ554_003082 [Drepanopeziza brunnea f. sp. 'monogermtubi']|nr:hypothetical protein LZ554_003082 [Drepanopeziza brunnea f. sp. 'monogermtubi']